MHRRRRYVIEVLALVAATGWLAVEAVRPAHAGFTPPVSSLCWSWSDLTVRSSPSAQAHQIARIETGESVSIIRRPDGWAAIIDTVAPGIIGFVPDSALHPQRLPTFAKAYSHIGDILDALRSDSQWASLEDQSRLRHVSNGMFEAVGTFTASHGESPGRQYRLLVQYTYDRGWGDVSLTIDHWGY